MQETNRSGDITAASYELTMIACFIGYIVQAIINNFLPLLFVRLQFQFHIPLSEITFLITFNFGLQLITDVLSVPFVSKVGYRVGMIVAHACAIAGLLGVVVLPEFLPSPFMGLLISVSIYAVGGGLLEVLVSPVVESCPTENKEKAMSLLHSFYCFGHMGVVLLSTLFFYICGIGNWKMLSMIWALVPAFNLFLFCKVPVPSPEERMQVEKDKTNNGNAPKERLLSKGIFWLFFVMMICSGASEQAVSQWASALAEKGLGIAKSLGDLLGPMFFAFMMGLSRLLYGKFGEKMSLKRFMALSVILCLLGYIGITLVPVPIVNLLCCGLVGFSVGIFWPGTFSLGAANLPKGGTRMFALYALAGDIGCMSGPTVAGRIAALAGENLKTGILGAFGFPILMGICLVFLYLIPRRKQKKQA